MNRRLLLGVMLAAIGLASAPAADSAGVVSINASAKPLGYAQVTSLSSATGLTAPAGTTFAVIVVETAAVRWRDDGTAPTASVGMPMSVGSSMIYTGSFTNLQFIQQATGAVLDVTFYA